MPIIVTVAPTILTADPNEYKKLVELYQGFTKRVQIDISDGSLTPHSTVPVNSIWWPQGWEADLHIISANPSAHIPAIIKLKPRMVILHAEAKEDLLPIFDQLHANNIKAGIAFLKQTYPGKFREQILQADHALIFSGKLGENGGEADFMQLEKIKIIKNIKPLIEIGWDGGVKLDNIRTIAQGGVNVINVGGTLKNAPDPAKMHADLVTEAEKPGVL